MTAVGRISLPAQDPFTGLSAHFGMLLGVGDLDTVVGHSWAKHRLHNSWLHGAAVVWGLGVSVADGEAKVAAGLATDAVGHELYLPSTYCIDLAAWRKNQDDVLGPDHSQPFDAHVVARFRACLSREVPALAAACEGGQAGTAYSRITETTELCLRPNLAQPEPDSSDFPRVRRLLPHPPPPPADPPVTPPPPGPAVAADETEAVAMIEVAEEGESLPVVVEAPEAEPEAIVAEAEVGAERASVQLAQLRLLAVYDGIERAPAPDSLYPGPEADPDYPDSDAGSVLLAELVGVRLTDNPGAATVERVDYSGRRQHVPALDLPELIPPQPNGGQQ